MQSPIQKMVLLILAALAAAAPQTRGQAVTQNIIDDFVPRVYRKASGDAMPYRLFIPHGYDDQKQYPLVMWLHGAGGAGTDNIAQISEDQISGTRTWTDPKVQSKYPSFVLVPQNPGNWVEKINALTPEMLLVLGIL